MCEGTGDGVRKIVNIQDVFLSKVSKLCVWSSVVALKAPEFTSCFIFHNSLKRNAAASLLDLFQRILFPWLRHIFTIYLCSVYEIRVSQVASMTYFTPYTSNINGNECLPFHFMQCRCWLVKLAYKSYFIHKLQCVLVRITK